MNSDQLLKFKAIAEHDTLTQAAESLFITQSALSHALSSLEDELNCKLFVREKKNLILNANGQTLLKYANAISNILAQAEKTFSNRQIIKLSAINVCAAFILSYYPKEELSNINLVQVQESDMPKMLLRSDIDIATCDDFYMKEFFDNKTNSSEIDRFLLCREQLCLQVPEGHSFYGREYVSYADLKDVPICIRIDDLSLKTWIDNIRTITNAKFDIDFAMDRFSYDMIRDGIDMPELKIVNSIYTPETKKKHEKKYKNVRIKDIYSDRLIYMWYLKSAYKKITPFIESVKMFYKKNKIKQN